MVSSRAARSAGRKPPKNPMVKANPMEEAAIDGERAKENAISENEPKFNVEMLMNRRSEANASPSAAPMSEIRRASPRKAVRMLRR